MASTAASAVLAAARILYETVQQVKANKRQARLLADRVGAIVGPVRAFSDAQLARPETQVALAQLLAVIEDASAFVHDFQDTGRLKRVIFKTGHTERFADLNTRLGHAAQALTLGAVLQLQFSSAEDARAETLDRVGDKEILGVWMITPPSVELVGRTAQLATLGEWLRQTPQVERAPAMRVAVSGMGGTGKSSLAHTAAAQHADRFTSGWILDGSNGDALVTSLKVVAHDLGLGDLQREQLPSAVRARLSQADRAGWLMLVDNVDDPDFGRMIEQWLPSVGGCILITSRLADWDRTGWHMLALTVLLHADSVLLLTSPAAATTTAASSAASAGAGSVGAASGGSASGGTTPAALVAPAAGASSATATAAAMSEVADMLGGLPLALAHARAYTRRLRISWPAYMERLKAQGAAVLSAATGGAGQRGSITVPAPVLPSLQLSLQAALQQSGTGARIMFELLQLLHADDIPRQLLSDAFVGAMRRFAGDGDGAAPPLNPDADEILALLADLSIVSLTEASVSTHRLMQQAMASVAPPQLVTAAALIAAIQVAGSFFSASFRYHDLGMIGRLLAHMARLQDWLEATAPTSVELSDVLFLYGFGSILLSTNQELSSACVERSAEIRCLSLPPTDPLVLIAQSFAAVSWAAIGRLTHAEMLIGRAMGNLQPGSAAPHAVTVIANAAAVDYYCGRYPDSAAKYLALLPDVRAAMGARHPLVAFNELILSWSLGALGRYDERMAMITRVVDVFQTHEGDSMFTAYALQSLAEAYGATGDTAAAVECAERGLRMMEHTTVNAANVTFQLVKLANAYAAVGRVHDQQRVLERALAFYTTTTYFGPQHLETARTRAGLCTARGALGDWAGQQALAEDALAVLEATLGPHHLEVAWALTSLGEAHVQLGDAHRGRVLLERAYIILRAWYAHGTAGLEGEGGRGAVGASAEGGQANGKGHEGDTHVGVARTMVALAGALGKLGDPVNQEMLLRKALESQHAHYAGVGGQHADVLRTEEALGRVLSDRAMVDRAEAQLAHVRLQSAADQ